MAESGIKVLKTTWWYPSFTRLNYMSDKMKKTADASSPRDIWPVLPFPPEVR